MELRMRLLLTSDYHVGAGNGLGSQVDSALLRDADNVPALRSTIQCLLRDGLRRLLHTTPQLKTYFAPHLQAEAGVTNIAAAYCKGATVCPMCRLFGTPAAPKRWRVSSPRPVGADEPLRANWKAGQTAAQVTARNRISPRQRRAQARGLFKQEEGDGRLAFDFMITCDDANDPARDEVNRDEAALVFAAARMVRRFGSGRRRGRGECVAHVVKSDGMVDDAGEKELLDRFEKAWLKGEQAAQTQPAVKAWTLPLVGDGVEKRFRIIVRTDEPVVVARRAEAGNMYDGLGYITGATLWGALAHQAAARWGLRRREDGCDDAFYQSSYGSNDPYRAFVELMLRGHVRVSPLYPAEFDPSKGGGNDRIYPTLPTPLDILTCKAYPGFATDNSVHHGAQGYASEQSVAKSCQARVFVDGSEKECGMPLQSLAGFLLVRSNTRRGGDARQRSELHPRINPDTQRVATGDLFGYIALDGGQYFVGDIWCRDRATWDALRELTGVLCGKQKFNLLLGKATRRGYGRVSVWIEEAVPDFWTGGVPVENRVTDATDVITLTLLTDTILPDAWGRCRQTFDAAALEEIIKLPVEEPIQVFVKSSYVDGFNNHLGLPRWRDIALKAGSSVGFKLKQPAVLETVQDRLTQIENEGIGLRRHEGFGQVAFNHPIYDGGSRLSDKGIVIPTDLRLATLPDADEDGDARSAARLKREAAALTEWQADLNGKDVFDEGLFRKGEWDSVARWLHEAAHLPVNKLESLLDQLGEASLLTTVRRDKPNRFRGKQTRDGEETSQDGDMSRAVKHLKALVRIAAEQAPNDVRERGLRIKLIANRLGAVVKRGGKENERLPCRSGKAHRAHRRACRVGRGRRRDGRPLLARRGGSLRSARDDGQRRVARDCDATRTAHAWGRRRL